MYILFITSTAPSELEPIFSFIISDSSVDVCVETESAMSLKLILRDTNSKRYVETSKIMRVLTHVIEFTMLN